MSRSGVLMRVPPEFRKMIRVKAGEKDLSMFEYLKKTVKDKNGYLNENFNFKW